MSRPRRTEGRRRRKVENRQCSVRPETAICLKIYGLSGQKLSTELSVSMFLFSQAKKYHLSEKHKQQIIKILLKKKYTAVLLWTKIRGDYICFSFNFIQPTFEVFKVGISFQSFNTHGRVAGLGRLSAGAKMAMKPFVKRVLTIFVTNASFLRVISNFRI